MTAKILDGSAVSKQILAETKDQVGAFELEWKATPTLALFRVGDDPASVSYAGMIERTCKKVGIAFQSQTLPADATEDEAIRVMRKLNDDKNVHGIILQQPLPEGIHAEAVVEAMDPAKDVDGAHPLNAGRLARAAFVDSPQNVGPYFVPATPLGGLELLKRYAIPVDGQRAVIVGASNLIGKPMSLLLTRHWATVTVCDLHTKPLSDLTKQADILVSVTGVPHLITADMIKPGATVLDFGFARLDGKWVGDVDAEAAKEVAGGLSPVPGGTGPMTNAMLMRNTLTAAERQVRLGVKAASQVSAVSLSSVSLGDSRQPADGIIQ
jgi:methylenetetrahydrofolate dehydrogenase (NADP+)/methenyltetrahydrofolate cyclohydrolase